MSEVHVERRLAAIAAVDLAGYSARSEADEAGAVRAVEALAALVQQAAAAHGGRVFNTAGDGFMLEFPTVSGAIEAAAAISDGSAAPVRVGVHLGEVTVTGKGDLLGHGVNVAARLQALARPGSVLVSDAARRALGGGAAGRLKPQGRVRLDKMHEVPAVHALIRRDGRAGGTRRRLPRVLPFAAAGVVLALAALLIALQWRGPGPQPVKVAVGEFTALAAGPARALAAGLPDELVSVLTDRQAPTVARGGDLSAARLLVTGDVSQSGEILRVRARLEDRRAGLSLWSGTYERPAAEADALQAQAAARVGDIVSRALLALGPRAGKVDPATLSDFLKLMDQFREGVRAAPANVELERRIVAAAPDFSYGHSNLAFDLATGGGGQASDAAKRSRQEARREAELALKLDPTNAEAYSALYVLDQKPVPGVRASMALPADPAAGEAILAKGLSISPNEPDLNIYLGNLLRNVGRTREAGALLQRATLLDPLSPAKVAGSVFFLAGTGQRLEAKALSDKALKLFPSYPAIGRAAVYTAVIYAPKGEALAAVERAAADGVFDEAAARLWRDYAASDRGRTDAGALRRLAAAAAIGQVDVATAVSALSAAGAVDAAFAVVDQALSQPVAFFPANLFDNATRPMRADPRFMRLADRLGLVRYWTRSGKWPDFCAEPGLAYDCKAEAAKLAPPDRPG